MEAVSPVGNVHHITVFGFRNHQKLQSLRYRAAGGATAVPCCYWWSVRWLKSEALLSPSSTSDLDLPVGCGCIGRIAFRLSNRHLNYSAPPLPLLGATSTEDGLCAVQPAGGICYYRNSDNHRQPTTKLRRSCKQMEYVDPVLQLFGHVCSQIHPDGGRIEGYVVRR